VLLGDGVLSVGARRRRPTQSGQPCPCRWDFGLLLQKRPWVGTEISTGQLVARGTSTRLVIRIGRRE